MWRDNNIGGGVQIYRGPYGGPPAPLHPAASRADWGRSTPMQEEPQWGWRSDGGWKTPFLSDNRSVFQWRANPNPLSHNFCLFLILLSVLDKESCELEGARQMLRIK